MIHQAALPESDLAAVVRSIPADGIQQEFPAWAAIVQWLAVDDVVRNFFNELRRQRVERCGIFALRQPVTFGGIVALGPETVISLSPEIFFDKSGVDIRVRPMKGTAKRGHLPIEDMARARRLGEDIKNRAENLMIVDLLRNDLSRLSEIGSVKVTDLFTVETYPTLHQMTSGIEARLRPGTTIAQLFAGLFPCGSVTGAPKIRAMEIIRELESAPRGVYCGSLGVIAPDGAMRFNVAIRTLTLFEDRSLLCNVGSAVFADSQADEEYAECLIKAAFLTGAS